VIVYAYPADQCDGLLPYKSMTAVLLLVSCLVLLVAFDASAEAR
jgi:hypothetical protein